MIFDCLTGFFGALLSFLENSVSTFTTISEMKIEKIPLFLWFVIAANIWWTVIVLLAHALYFSSSVDNIEGAGFLLAFMGLPATMLVSFFDASVQMQILLMACFGYLQWNLIGLSLGFFVKRIMQTKTDVI